jgi:hydrogenase-4 component B
MLVVLGLAGALLHVWNHALFKALLFLSAGSVIHAAHTRAIDHLGGLAKRMPRTAMCFLVGAVAICGLPPLNGFVSEFLIYLGLFETLRINSDRSIAGAVFAVPALALIGALAAACFVKVFGAVFLGTARSEHAEHAHESGWALIGPMGVLAVCCFIIGLAPTLIAPVLSQGVAAWAPHLEVPAGGLAGAAPLGWISAMAIALTAALAMFTLLLSWRLGSAALEAGPTWGCGYAAPTARMQYTSSSFAQMVVGLFAWALRPRVHQAKPTGLFPHEGSFHSEVPETVLDEAVSPTFRFSAWLFSWARVFQQGNIQAYLLYVFLTLIALLLWLHWR